MNKIFQFSQYAAKRSLKKGSAGRNDGHLIFAYLLQFVIVLTIPLLLVSIYYFMTVQVVEEDYEKSVLAILDQSSQFCDQRFAEMDAIVKQLVGNPKVQVFKNKTDPLHYPNTYSINETMRSLVDVEASNAFLLDYYLLFNNSKLVVNSRIAYTYEDFYKLYFSYRNMDYGQWYSQIAGGKYGRQIIGATPALCLAHNPGATSNPRVQQDVITYIQPITSTDSKTGYVMFLIDNREITQMLSRINISEGGFAFVVDRNSNLISSIGSTAGFDPTMIRHIMDKFSDAGNSFDKERIDGKDMLISHVTSPYNGFRYVSVQPAHVVLAKLNYIRYILIIYLALSLLFGLAVSIYMSCRRARIIVDIVKDIRDYNSKNFREPFNAIKEAFSALTSDNRLLTRTIDQQKPILKSTLLARLLHGEFASSDEIVKLLPSVDIELKAKFYCSVLLQYRSQILSMESPTPLELSRLRAIIREALEAYFGPDPLYCDVDEEKVVLILCCDMGKQAEAWDYVVSSVGCIGRLLEEQSVVLSVGTLVDTPMEISRSYEQARVSLNLHIFHSKDKIIYPNPENDGVETYYFPQDIRNRLAGSVRTGNREGVQALLHELIEKNVVSMELPLSVQRVFLYDLLAYATQLAGQFAMKKEEYHLFIESLDKMEKMGDLNRINMICNMYAQLCNTVQAHLEHQRSAFVDDIEQFVRENYTNPDLSLTMISEKFSINEAYLSHIFKQRTGQNFSVYLEKLRMERAVYLLSQTDMLICDIAKELGYYSANTFCRAFKRVYNMNAGGFRKNRQVLETAAKS